MQTAVNDEKNSKWNGKIALITLTEALRTNTDNGCVNYPFDQYYYVPNCMDTTWINYVSNMGWSMPSMGWLITPDKNDEAQIWTFPGSSSIFQLEDLTDGHYYSSFPVLHLKANL